MEIFKSGHLMYVPNSFEVHLIVIESTKIIAQIRFGLGFVKVRNIILDYG